MKSRHDRARRRRSARSRPHRAPRPDYQPGILGPLADADALVERAGRAIAAMRGAGAATTQVDGRLAPEPGDVVVLSTVRDGHDRDYRLLVLADACADPEPDVHAFLTERIFPRQAEVIEVADLGSLLSA